MQASSEPNPLLRIEFRAPFDKIRPEHVQPAVEQLLEDARRRLDHLIDTPGPRTFANTMQALDYLTEPLEYAMGVVRHLTGVANTPELRAAFNAVEPQVMAFYASLPLNEGLWNAVKAFSATEEARALKGARARFLKKTIDSFRRHGAELDPAGKQRLQEIDVEMSKLTTKFSENVLDSTNAYELVIRDEAKLAGLPDSAIAAASENAAAKGLPQPAWRFTLQAPSYLAVVTYLNDPDIRAQMWHAYATRAT